MRYLTVNDLYIFSPKEERARHIPFSSGINIITSDKSDGNKKGKSIILKSIYHTLGADSHFDDHWESESKVYVLDFTIDESSYRICRFNRLFKVFDSSSNLCIQTIDRKELATYLNTLFCFSVRLPNRSEDKLEITSPVYNYILNYLDQDKMECTHFNSFRGLNQYKDYKANTIYYHLGVFDEKYYTIIKDIEKSTDIESQLKEEQHALSQVVSRINQSIQNSDMPTTDFSILEQDVSQYTQEYNSIVMELKKTRAALIKLRNDYSDTQQMLISLKGIDKQIDLEIQKLNDNICPYCSSHIEDTSEHRMVKYSDSEDVHILTLDLQTHIIELEQKISAAEDKYKAISSKLKSYEDAINIGQKEITDILQAKSLREILDKFKVDLGSVSNKLLDVETQLIELRKQKKVYDQKKRAVNKKYSELMLADKTSFGLQEIDSKRFDSIDLTFEAGGSNRPIATVIWYFNLLRLKSEFNSASIHFPIVLDSPNNVELDDGKRKELFEYLFKNIDENTQLIVSTLGFNPIDYPGVKFGSILSLSNPKYSLLTEEDYTTYFPILVLCDQVE